MKSQVERNFELYREGVNILPLLPTRLRFQIRLTILGGQEILNKIRSADFNVLNVRPKLSKIDYIKLFLKAALR
jgi:phytoene/squalene synthetase